MLTTADLDRLIERPTTTEKENKVEAIQHEASKRSPHSITTGSSAFAKGFEAELNALTRSGLAGVRTQAKEILQKLQSTPAS